jgi:hypothetical protein
MNYKRWREGVNPRYAGRVVMLLWFLSGLLAGCYIGLERASIPMIDAAEANWQANPVPGYDITVEVDRPGERRRNEISVRQGQVRRAVVRSWDPDEKRWQEPAPLNEEQAFPFTVPGLFDMVRDELRHSGRADIRVMIGKSPASFPRRLVLGPVWQAGQPVTGTEATVTVRKFEPAAAAD